MDIKRAIAVTGLVAATAGISPAAFAQDKGWYIGGAVGQSEVDINRGELAADFTAAGLTNTGFTADEEDTGRKLFGGYRFNKYFAVEGAYANLGSFSASTTVSAVGGVPIAPLGVTASVKAKDAFYISAVGTLPVTEKFSVFGKLGVYSIKTTLNVSVAGTLVIESDRNEDLTFGVGLGYDFTRNFGIRGEWERFNKVGNRDKTAEGDVDLLSVGLVYKF